MSEFTKPQIAYAHGAGYFCTIVRLFGPDRPGDFSAGDQGIYHGTGLLCGFAIELLLKAYLMEKGVAEAKLRKRSLGHDLAALFDRAEQLGFECTGTSELVEYFGPGHKSLAHRYGFDVPEWTVPDMLLVQRMLSDLSQYVGRTVGALD